MSTDVGYRFDPREDQREVLRRRRFRKKLWRKSIHWLVFSAVVLLTVFILVESINWMQGAFENTNPLGTRGRTF